MMMQTAMLWPTITPTRNRPTIHSVRMLRMSHERETMQAEDTGQGIGKSRMQKTPVGTMKSAILHECREIMSA